MKYNDSPDLNAPKRYPTLYARTHGITARNNWCFRCTLHSIINTDSNEKRHNLSGIDLIQHEIKCVSELERIINYYNRYELSSFHVEMIIP